MKRNRRMMENRKKVIRRLSLLIFMMLYCGIFSACGNQADKDEQTESKYETYKVQMDPQYVTEYYKSMGLENIKLLSHEITITDELYGRDSTLDTIVLEGDVIGDISIKYKIKSMWVVEEKIMELDSFEIEDIDFSKLEGKEIALERFLGNYAIKLFLDSGTDWNAMSLS